MEKRTGQDRISQPVQLQRRCLCRWGKLARSPIIHRQARDVIQPRLDDVRGSRCEDHPQLERWQRGHGSVSQKLEGRLTARSAASRAIVGLCRQGIERPASCQLLTAL